MILPFRVTIGPAENHVRAAPYHDRSTSMLDSWKETLTIIRLCRCPPNVHPFRCWEKCETRFDRPYCFLPLIN
ncbi:hypothetical protein TNCV_1885311 [Trichonephila clavipes]|nr:hypothetical protein TNCV_1885311 [Trichonephila clavipes]